MFEINQWLLLLSTSRKWFADNPDWRQDGGNQSMRKPNTLKIQKAKPTWAVPSFQMEKERISTPPSSRGSEGK